MSDEILITNARVGTPPMVVLCDATIGAVKIFDVMLRIGRGKTSFINLPRSWKNGRWAATVEVTDAVLMAALRRKVEDAAAEILRYDFA